MSISGRQQYFLKKLNKKSHQNYKASKYQFFNYKNFLLDQVVFV